MGDRPLSSEFLAHCIRRSGALIRAVLQSVIRGRLQQRYGDRAEKVLWDAIIRASQSSYDSARTCEIFLKEHKNDPQFIYRMDYTVCNAVMRDEQLGLLISDKEAAMISQVGRVRGDQAHEGDTLADPDDLSREHWEKNRHRIRALGEMFRSYLDDETYANLVEYYNGRGGKFVPSRARQQAGAELAEEDDWQDDWQDDWNGSPSGSNGSYVDSGNGLVYSVTSYDRYVPPKNQPTKPVETPEQREARLRREALIRKILLRSFLALVALAVVVVTLGPPLVYGYAMSKLEKGDLLSAYAAFDRISMLHGDLEEKRVAVLNQIREDMMEDGYRQEIIDEAKNMAGHPAGFLLEYEYLGEFTAVPSHTALVYQPAGETGYFTEFQGNPMALTLPEGAQPIWAWSDASSSADFNRWILCADGSVLYGEVTWNFSASKYADPSWFDEQYRLIAEEGMTLTEVASIPGARRVITMDYGAGILWMEDGRVIRFDSGSWIADGLRPEDGVLLYENVIGFLEENLNWPINEQGFRAMDVSASTVSYTVYDSAGTPESFPEVDVDDVFERATGDVTVMKDGRCFNSISHEANDGNDTLFADLRWGGHPLTVYDLMED